MNIQPLYDFILEHNPSVWVLAGAITLITIISVIAGLFIFELAVMAVQALLDRRNERDEHDSDLRTGTLPDNVIVLPYRHTWPSWGREHWAGA